MDVGDRLPPSTYGIANPREGITPGDNFLSAQACVGGDEDDWRFGGLRRNHYGVILADAPWKFLTRSDKGKGRSPDSHYGCMTLDDIKALPVADLAAKDCVLFFWAIDPLLDVAFDVIRCWGFRFVTVGFYWAKTNRDGSPFCGMGYWSRANPEQCLMAVRGRPKRLHKDVRRLIIAQRREHSRKPDEVRDSIQRLVPGPYCELFARSTAPGWDSFGNETTKFDQEAPACSATHTISPS